MKSVAEWFKLSCTCAQPELMEVSGQCCDDCGYLLPQAKKVDA
jgi:hypothetical protein